MSLISHGEVMVGKKQVLKTGDRRTVFKKWNRAAVRIMSPNWGLFADRHLEDVDL